MSIKLLDSKDKQELQEQNENKIDKSGITLGVHTDGLMYVFIDGVPIGNGVISPSIEAPQIVSFIEEMTDTAKHYILNGYIYSNRKVVIEGGITSPNMFTPTEDCINNRLSGSSGSVSSQNGSFVTDFISVANSIANNTPFNIRINTEVANSSENKIVYYNASKTRIGQSLLEVGQNTTISNSETVSDIRTMSSGSSVEPSWSDVAYIRVQYVLHPTDAITFDDIKNLKITFDVNNVATEPTETIEWVNSGISYLPNIKTDLIGVLTEDNVIYLSDNLPSGTYTLKYGDETYDTVGTITVD